MTIKTRDMPGVETLIRSVRLSDARMKNMEATFEAMQSQYPHSYLLLQMEAAYKVYTAPEMLFRATNSHSLFYIDQALCNHPEAIAPLELTDTCFVHRWSGTRAASAVLQHLIDTAVCCMAIGTHPGRVHSLIVEVAVKEPKKLLETFADLDKGRKGVTKFTKSNQLAVTKAEANLSTP